MRKYIALIAVLPLIAGCLPLTLPTGAASTTRPAAFVREVIVKLRQPAVSPDGATSQAADYDGKLLAVARALGERTGPLAENGVEPLAPRTGVLRARRIISDSGLDRLFVMRFETPVDLASALSSLRAAAEVEYAEPNRRVQVASVAQNQIVIPDDPRFFDQWGLRNMGLNIDGQRAAYRADIHAAEAWAITTGSPDVLIAVSDTGIDIDHPDLAPNIYTNPLEIPDNGIDDDGNGYIDDVHGFNVGEGNSDISDVLGHGTEMAGIMAARVNNMVGISGISQSKIIPVRFFRKDGPDPGDFDATVSDAIRSLIYSIVIGADIINASWITMLAPGEVEPDEPAALKDAVTATRNAGIILVCVAGNDGFDTDVSKVYPGAYQLQNQIVVAASDYNDDAWHPPFFPHFIRTGFGKKTVALMAPGVSVLTVQARGNCFLCSESEDPLDWYSRTDGTSASAAFVTGVAALVKSLYPDDYVTLIRRRMLEGVDVHEHLERFCSTSGRLNALGALTSTFELDAPVIDRVKYKGATGKLVVFGEKMGRDSLVLINGIAYELKPKPNPNKFIARVPLERLPNGVEVVIRVNNPDGATSNSVNFTR